QGTIGGVYAEMAGEPKAVAEAIREHYLPEGGDDPLPRSLLARLIGVIERADKLVGYFEAGLAPTATRDPYALRRAAIGLVRLLSAEDEPIPVPLEAILNQVAEGWECLPPHLAIRKETVEAVRAFVHERIEGMAEALGASRAAWRAALAAACTRPLVQQRRLAAALDALRGTERGQAIAAANKRVANILRQAGVEPDLAAGVDPELFRAEAEQALWQALRDLEDHWPEAPEAALEALATMREPIDRFFDEVLVLDPDPAVRANRLALLARLRARFLQVADVSLLAERRGLNADS
ncbi:MAG: glycine--tRNA ligase subunit beta, partial [Zetaproteobacteria bacterium]